MSSFVEKILQNPTTVRKSKMISKSPFQGITISKGDREELFGFTCDRTYVKVTALDKLKKYVKISRLRDLSQFSRGSYCCAACVIEVKKKSIIVSDLRTTTKILLFSCHIPIPFEPSDIILFANAPIHTDIIEISSEDQIIKIGHNDFIEECSHYHEGDKCSKCVDSRKNSMCDIHCHQKYKESSNQRMILRSACPCEENNRQKPFNFSCFSIQTKPEENLKELKEYLSKHTNSRQDKIVQSMQIMSSPQSSPILGQGFRKGDMIPLF